MVFHLNYFSTGLFYHWKTVEIKQNVMYIVYNRYDMIVQDLEAFLCELWSASLLFVYSLISILDPSDLRMLMSFLAPCLSSY